MSALRCDSNKNHDLGTTSIKWGTAHLGDIKSETGTISGDFEVQGNLTVTGTSTSLQVSTVEAEDPLIKLARGNSADSLDIGFYGQSNDGSNKFHGLFRDQNDSGKFKLFVDLASEPTTTVGDLSSSNKATLVADIEGDVTGALTGNADTATTLATARSIAIAGDVAGTVSFNGSADVSITSTIQATSVENSMLAGSISNDKLSNSAITVTAGDAITGGGSVSLGGTVSLAVGVDDSSIETSSDALRVKAAGITNAMLAGSIADSNLSTISTANKVSGSAVQIASTSALEDSTGLRIKAATAGDGLAISNQVLSVGVDDSSLEISSDALRVKAVGVTNAMLAGSIANAKLTNSSVSFGGIQLALGASDATPAFDLSDATSYPTSALVGTITNAQLAGSIANDKLAGSIANSKLANDSVSFGGVSLDLGGTDATPAFDLQDATGYPAASLVGNITNAQLAGSIANDKLSNSGITIGDGSNSEAVALGGEFEIKGTSNEVEVVYNTTNNDFTIGLPDTIAAALTGNADTATKFAATKNIGITGGPVTAANIAFDGSGNVALTSAIAADAITNAMIANDHLTLATTGTGADFDIHFGDTLNINGTSDEVDVTIGSDAITIGLPNDITINNDLDVGGDFSSTGNVVVGGNLTAAAATVTLGDTLLELGVNNTSAVDHGFYSQRASNSFCGFFFDETDDKFKPFTHDTEPSSDVVAVSGNYTKGAMDIGALECASVDCAGNVIGQLRMEGSVPGSGSATGTAGDMRFDSANLYVCVAANTWKSVGLTGL